MKKPKNKEVHNRKAKGRNFQRTICKKFAKAFKLEIPDDLRTAVGFETGSDVKLTSKEAQERIGLVIECKNQKALSLWATIEQVKAMAKKEKGMPCIIFKNPSGIRKAWIAMQFDDYLDMAVELDEYRRGKC